MKRRYLVLFVVAPVLLVLAVAVFYWVENWRGAQEWEAVRSNLTAHGEPLELAALLPAPVPDEQNLAKAPLLERAVSDGYLPAGTGSAVTWMDMPFGRDGDQSDVSRDNWTTGHALPLVEWQKHFAKSKQCSHPATPGALEGDVLMALTVFAPLLDELVHETETRTQGIAPIDLRSESMMNIRFPAGYLFIKAVETLRLRAVAELATGQHADALRDTRAALRLTAALGREPLLFGFSEYCLCASLALQPVWEGLAARRWTAEELHFIEESLRQDDPLANYVRAVRGDRVISCSTLEFIRKSSKNGEAFLTGGKPASPMEEWIARLFTMGPRGWVDQNKAVTSRLYQLHVEAVDLPTRRIMLEKATAANAEVEALGKKPYLVYTLLARGVMPMTSYLVPRAARMQTECDQAVVACALERYYLDRHDYPDALDALVPGYLDGVPNDVIDNAPMRYRRTNDERYLLYGIGWNGRDDGGMVAWRSKSSPKEHFRTNDSEGDWVWQYAPVEPPAGP